MTVVTVPGQVSGSLLDVPVMGSGQCLRFLYLLTILGYCLSLLYLVTISGLILWLLYLVIVVEKVSDFSGHSIWVMTLFTMSGLSIWLLYCVMVSWYYLVVCTLPSLGIWLVSLVTGHSIWLMSVAHEPGQSKCIISLGYVLGHRIGLNSLWLSYFSQELLMALVSVLVAISG